MVKLYHLGLTIENVVTLLGFKKLKALSTWLQEIMLLSRRKAAEYQILHASIKNRSKNIKFHYFFFFYFRLLSPVNRRGHLRSLSTSLNSGTQPFILDLSDTPLCPSLPQVPATASFCLAARSTISLGICLFHLCPPPPPPSRNLFPSWQAEGQKSLKGAASTAYTQVLPLHILPNNNLLFSFLHNILYLSNA